MRTFLLLTKHTVRKYSDDNCSLLAAAISYYVLFSVVPLTIFLASIFGFVMRDANTRQEVVDRIVQATPLQQQEGTDLVSNTVKGVSRVSLPLTVVGLVGLAWSGSAMFAAIRRGLNIAFGVEKARPVVQQKLVDLAMLSGFALVLLISVAGTGFLHTLRARSLNLLGPLSSGSSRFWAVVPFLAPAVFSFLLFLLLYRYVPRVGLGFRDVWPGALLATVLFEVLKNGFALYIDNFSNYDLAYGALGGILLFLLWTYLTASILLLGAELASEYPRVRDGLYAEAEGPSQPLREQALRVAKGLFVHQEPKDRTPQPRRKP
jgi:membrane protein